MERAAEKDGYGGLRTESFSYSRGFAVLFFLVHTFCLTFPAVLSILAVLVFQEHQDFWDLTLRFAHPLGLGWFWAILVAASLRMFIVHRPVRVSRNEVVATMFGRCWRRFPWSEIERIEKRTTFEHERGGVVETIVFSRQNRRIYVKSYIANYREFKRLVNACLKMYPTEVVDIDTSRNSSETRTSLHGRI